jgi:hypothetical protein
MQRFLYFLGNDKSAHVRVFFFFFPSANLRFSYGFCFAIFLLGFTLRFFLGEFSGLGL